MNDLISRQAAIDEFYMSTCDGDKVEWAEMVLKRVPFAEPQIIRCEDCKHNDEYNWCDYHDCFTNKIHFCGAAERR